MSETLVMTVPFGIVMTSFSPIAAPAATLISFIVLPMTVYSSVNPLLWSKLASTKR